jgi:molecular chaperone HtpG
VLDLIAKLAEKEPEKYQTFWQQFGEVLKEGLAEDSSNKDRIAKLLRFHSTVSEGDKPTRSLAEYCAAQESEQKKIYYLVADSLSVARSSPHLEIFRERGIEVLLLVDRIDEWVLQYFTEFDGRPLKDIARGELDLDAVDTTAKDKQDDATAEDSTFIGRVKEALGDQVDAVRVSHRLKESPACLVLGEDELGFQMREMLKAAGHEAPTGMPSLELNMGHPLIRRLSREETDDGFSRLALLVLDLARLAEGRQLQDPAGYTRRLNDFFLALGLDDSPPAEERA